MPLDLPIVPIGQSYVANTHGPMDLSTQLQRNIDSFNHGYINESDIEKRGVVGTTDAQAARAQNQASRAKSQQDLIDEQGAPASAPAPAGGEPIRRTGLQSLSTDELLRLGTQHGLL